MLPENHAKKMGTPTMGGVLILLSIGISTLLWADLTNPYVWIVLSVMVILCRWLWMIKIRYKDNAGLPARRNSSGHQWVLWVLVLRCM